MAKCFNNLTNIVESCEGSSSGYTGKVWLLPSTCFAVFEEGNRNVVSQINRLTAEASMQYFSCYDAELIDPLTGTALAGNTDSGRRLFQKTVSLRIPVRNADAVETVLMPLVENRAGWIIIAETKSPELSSAFRIFGAYDYCVADVASITQNEYENGGDWVVPLVCTEPVSDVAFVRGGAASKRDMLTWLNEKCS